MNLRESEAGESQGVVPSGHPSGTPTGISCKQEQLVATSLSCRLFSKDARMLYLLNTLPTEGLLLGNSFSLTLGLSVLFMRFSFFPRDIFQIF